MTVRPGREAEISINPASGVTVPEGDPSAASSAAGTQVWLGTSSAVVELTPDLASLQLTGSGTPERHARRTGPPPLGMSASAVHGGWSASASARVTAGNESMLLRTARAVLWLERGGWAWALPMLVSAAPVTAPVAGIQTVQVGLVPDRDALPVVGPVATTGQKKVAAGQAGWQRTSSGIAALTSTAVTASAAAPVVGPAAPWVPNDALPTTTPVALRGLARGLTQASVALGRDTRSVPSGPRASNVLGSRVDRDLTLALASTPLTDAVMRDAHMARRKVGARLSGSADTLSGEAVLTVALALDWGSDSAEWSAGVHWDGLPT